jgi:hypothetical protein
MMTRARRAVEAEYGEELRFEEAGTESEASEPE